MIFLELSKSFGTLNRKTLFLDPRPKKENEVGHF